MLELIGLVLSNDYQLAECYMKDHGYIEECDCHQTLNLIDEQVCSRRPNASDCNHKSLISTSVPRLIVLLEFFVIFVYDLWLRSTKST